MKSVLFLPFLLVLFISCNEAAKKVGEEVARSQQIADSLADMKLDDSEGEKQYFSRDSKIIERKKNGSDSLYLVRRFYTDGVKFSETWYRNNVRDGIATLWHKDGSLFCKLILKNDLEYTVSEGYDTKGKPLNCGSLRNGNGILNFYDPITDKIISVVSYKDGLREGPFSIYYQSGELYRKGSFTQDTVTGPFVEYFKKGKVREKGAFVHNRLDGVHYTYYRSGKVRLYEKWQDKKVLAYAEYDRQEKMLRSATLVPEGYLETRYDYSPNGKMRSRGRFMNGMKSGSYEYFGNDYKRAEELWRNDTLLKELAWYSNKQLRSLTVYKDNEKDSIYTEYYSTGKLRLQQAYKKGKKEGAYISYFENGNKYVEGIYSEDKPKGLFKHYHKDGTYNGSYTVRQQN